MQRRQLLLLSVGILLPVRAAAASPERDSTSPPAVPDSTIGSPRHTILTVLGLALFCISIQMCRRFTRASV